MTKFHAVLAIVAALPALHQPVAAQNAVQNGVLVIYGNDKCPTDTDGNEIVVCARRPEAERYRIPKDLREFEVTPQNQAWATRVPEALAAGDTGIGSCSTVGAGAATGCNQAQLDAWKAEQRAKKRAEAGIPLPN